jgi:diguanylate cyclase (GGDEF)-like protein
MNTLWMTALAGGSTLGATVSYLGSRVRGVRRELAEVRRALVESRRVASVDALTGLANRAGLMEEMECRAAGVEQFAVLLVDLDGFKAVNDTYGHDAGDLVLVEVAARLSTLVAGAGLAGRLGGDEFVIVASSPVQVVSKLLGHDLARAVARPIVFTDGVQVEVRASVGLVQALPGDDPRAVLRSADAAMYRAKRGRGQAGVAEFDAVLGLREVAEERPSTGTRLREIAATARDLAGVTA